GSGCEGAVAVGVRPRRQGQREGADVIENGGLAVAVRHDREEIRTRQTAEPIARHHGGTFRGSAFAVSGSPVMSCFVTPDGGETAVGAGARDAIPRVAVRRAD